MKMSIVVPAYNEQACIVGCLRAIRESVGGAADVETIVVDNNSTDATAELARREGARVVFEKENRISKARNAGGRAARGEWILFIDADSLLSPALLERIRERTRQTDVAGGGALVEFDRAPLWGWAMSVLQWVTAPLTGIGGGPCLFIRADGFRAIGGFREDLYGSEELYFSRDAADWGKRNGMRFVILRRPHILTSGRRFRVNGPREIFMALVGVARNPRSRKDCAIWYDGRR
jgi:glycosyltransferase involved in cell wall biosynthesis